MIVSSPVTCNSFVSSASTSMSASVSRGVVVDVRSRRGRYVVRGWRVVAIALLLVMPLFWKRKA